jgi:carbon storage regulator
MLVLSRKKNESIMIGDSIEIKVIAIEGDHVRIGIEAPRNIEVYRREVYLAIQEENELASRTKVDMTTLKQLMSQAKNQSGEE